MKWFLAPLAALTGGIAALKVGIDGQLAQKLNEGMAATVSFALALTLALTASALAGQLQVPSRDALAQIPWYLWSGGLLSVALVAGGIFIAPKLGAAYYVVLTVAGQILVGLALDHFGAFAFEQSAMSWGRAGGAALVVAGVVLIQRT